jgi:hypothetical protein
MADTGITPVSRFRRKRRSRRSRRNRSTPLWLVTIVVLVALLVLVGTAGLVINHYRPQWIRSLGINTGSGGGTGTTVPAHTSAGPEAGTRAALVTPATSTPTSATFDVHARAFLVGVTAVGGPAWVQATLAHQSTPAFAGVLQPGQSKAFLVGEALTLQLGSRAAQVSVAVGPHKVASYVPSEAPFNLTYQTTR